MQSAMPMQRHIARVCRPRCRPVGSVTIGKRAKSDREALAQRSFPFCVLPVQQYQVPARITLEDAAQERIAIGMQLEERLRAQIQRARLRQPEVTAVAPAGWCRWAIVVCEC